MKIDSKHVGGNRTYIIAEFGVNHNGSIRRAKEGIREAAAAGADAIKFQTYTADELVVKGTPKFWNAEVDKDKEGQWEAYKSLEGFKYEWYPDLIEYAKKHGITLFSTPFSIEAADKLNEMGVQAFKIASSDMSTIPLLKHIAKFNKPIFLSTGAADLSEIKQAVKAIEEEGNDKVIILHCTLCYPTAEDDANLSIIKTLQKEFPWHYIGLSDHTLGAYPPQIAVAAGAKVIEKHFTVDKTLDKSADHWLSVDPGELKELVDGVRRVETLLGRPDKVVYAAEAHTRKWDKRSIVSKVELKADEPVTEDMVTFKRPGTGIWPDKLERLVGKKPKLTIPANTVLTWEQFHQR